MSFKYRDVLIWDDKVLDDSGTNGPDLELPDPITELTLYFHLTNGGSILHDKPPELAISKIEIVDGGTTYWSLSGPRAVAAAAYEIGHYPSHYYSEDANGFQSIAIPIRFGRWLGDPLFAFVAPRLTNPQLRVTWAKDAGHLAGSVRLGVWARIMEGLTPPANALMWRDVESFTSAASGDHDTKLPHDYPYRRLLVRPYKSDTIPTDIITNLRLDCDKGKFKPFDLSSGEFEEIQRNFFGPFTLKKMDRVSQNSYHQTWMASHTFAMIAMETVGNPASAWATGSIMYQQTMAIAANLRAETLIWGYQPHNGFCWQFGLPDEPDTWFPTRDYGEEILWLTQGAASGDVGVAVQQPCPLP